MSKRRRIRKKGDGNADMKKQDKDEKGRRGGKEKGGRREG